MTNDVYSIRFTDEQIARIDAWRAQQPKWPSRGEAVRWLVEHGLQCDFNGTVKQQPKVKFFSCDGTVTNLLKGWYWCEIVEAGHNGSPRGPFDTFDAAQLSAMGSYGKARETADERR